MTEISRNHSTCTRRLLLAGSIGMLAPRIVNPQVAVAEATPSATAGPMLVNPETLAANEAGTNPTIVAVTPGKEFVGGHIPGARTVDWPAFELKDSSTEDALATWRALAVATLGDLGIHAKSDVVAYDGGTVFGCRLVWVLAYLGGQRSRVLDGGLPAWAAEDLRVVKGEGSKIARSMYFPEIDASQLAKLSDAAEAVGEAGVAFVDVRAADEYANGHIPGAVNIPYLMNVRSSGVPTWLTVAERSVLYQDHGISPESLVIPYCSTGVRSSVTWFSLRELGYSRVSLFSGSWAEWSAHPDLPVTTGVNP